MKKLIAFLILSILSCNFAIAEVIFYEDFTFYGRLTTDIALSEADREQKIQVVFPSFLNKKIPIILDGKATTKRIDGKSMICLQLDEMSIDARKHMPVEIIVTGINGQKLEQACYPNQNWYIAGFKRANKLSKEVGLYPINSYKAMSKIAKPSSNNFIMLLEPAYALVGSVLFGLSPITAPLFVKDGFSDIPRGSMVEFQFLKEIDRQELKKIINEVIHEEYM